MNRGLISLAAVAAVCGIVFAQAPGLPGGQQAPEGRPFGGPGLGGMMQARVGGGSASVAAAGNYVYVVSGGTLYQYSVDGLKLVTKAQLPAQERGQGGQGGGEGRGGGNRRNNPPVN